MDNLNRVEQKVEKQLLDLNVKDRNETFNSIQYKYIETNKEKSNNISGEKNTYNVHDYLIAMVI
jgi:hypothetical protein